jgi:hypothetical protein
MSTRTNLSRYNKLNIDPCDPDFAVHVYVIDGRMDATAEALRAADQHAYILRADHDPVAHHYVTDVLDCYSWPVVTITSGAELIAHWDGYRPDMLALIPQLRAQYTKAAA